MLAIGHKRSKCCCSIAVEEHGWARRRSGKVRPPRIFFDATTKGPRDNNHNHNLILKIGHSTRAALRQSPEARLCLFTRMSAWLEPPRGRHSAMGASRVSATSLLALLEYLQSPLHLCMRRRTSQFHPSTPANAYIVFIKRLKWNPKPSAQLST